MYAIVELSGKQIKVSEGDSVRIPLRNGNIGDNITISNVLYLDDGKEKTFGIPYIDKVSVSSEIIEQVSSKKVPVFKFTRRKGYQRKLGHTQRFTRVRITTLNIKSAN